MNYYNEFDPKAAAWLRELIAEGHIPPGDVDERSIIDVKPHELTPYAQQHFFTGIGGWPLALRLAGWPDSRPVRSGSCPCQPFSAAGKQQGTKDERHLWPVFRDLITFGDATITFGEQVASELGRDWLAGVRADLEGLGYEVGAADLCAASAGEIGEIGILRGGKVHWERGIIGAPHIRQRLYWVANANAGKCRRVAKSQGCERDGETTRRKQGDSESKCGGTIGGLVQPDGAGRESRERTTKGTRHGNSAEPTSDAARMEHSTGDGREQRRPESGGRGAASGCGASVERMGNPDNSRSRGRNLRGNGSNERIVRTAGLGHWSTFDVLPCLDRKARRVESGTFPLAHGVSDRVGLLRGYGNAIVPQVAAEFIRSAIEVIEA